MVCLSSGEYYLGGEAMKAVHLACGAGGITLGFERAGIETEYAFDVWPVAVESHRANFPNRPCEVCDIREVQASDLPHADCWTCGIPCEPYSIAGSRKGENDQRDIAFEVARLIREGKPQYIFLENVPPFQASAGAAAIREALAGYAVLEAVFLHADYGVPQLRRRWHIVASSTPPAPVPEPTHSECPSLFGLRPWIRFGAIRDGTGVEPISARALRYVFNHSIKNAAKYGDGFAPIIITDDDVLSTILSSQYKGQWRTNVSIVYEDGCLRPLSLLEARRGQGFPDDFVFCGGRINQWQQVGGAVAPPFAEAVAKAIILNRSVIVWR